MRRLERATATSGSGGHSNTVQVERDHEVLGRDAGEIDIAGIWQSWSVRSVNLGVHTGPEKLSFEVIPECSNANRRALIDEFDCFRERHSSHDVFGASPTSSFMPTANRGCLKRHTLPDIQSPSAFRRVHLVRAHRVEIHTEVFEVERNLTEGLHAVRMEINFLPGVPTSKNGGPDLANRLNRPDFVVGMHHRNQDSGLSDGSINRFSI